MVPGSRGLSERSDGFRGDGEDFLVDETLWTGEITDGHWCLCDGKSGHASFWLLHVFEFAADGKIKSERVWVDLAAIQQQLS
jgi:hypothetical protein